MLLNPKPHKGNVCSQRSFARADKQKVVSFSFWGEMNTGDAFLGREFPVHFFERKGK